MRIPLILAALLAACVPVAANKPISQQPTAQQQPHSKSDQATVAADGAASAEHSEVIGLTGSELAVVLGVALSLCLGAVVTVSLLRRRNGRPPDPLLPTPI